jgi:tRNA U34 5-methylaminomethyl-2-thiouridine-forming methyltransferase MnmC
MELRLTSDGSHTVFSDCFSETYHSVNGAVTESIHVFIGCGLNACIKKSIRVFEVGFGTGLNALLTFIEGRKRGVAIEYQTIELYPLPMEVVEQLSYHDFLSCDLQLFRAFHEAEWNQLVRISDDFYLKKISSDLLAASFTDFYDVVYFDAFSPAIQPALWTEDIFHKIYQQMSEGGILTTYCAKGEVRRNMIAAGFSVERLPGPPGKREMLKAQKKC